MSRSLMASIKRRTHSVVAVLQAFVLVGASFVPLLTVAQVQAAAQLTNRKITIGGDGVQATTNATKAGQTDVTYSVDFNTVTTGNIGGMVIDFCSNSPVIGLACTPPTGFDINKLTLVIAAQSGITNWAIDSSTSTANKLVLTRTPASFTAGAMALDLGSSGGTDGVTNPSTACNPGAADVCTFYARILTFAVTVGATGYASATPSNGAAPVDQGGLALSTADQLTITARVQEVLHFCVGVTDLDTNNDCRDLTGTAVDLGVVDSSAVNTATAKAMLRTNAALGTSVTYFAEKDTTSGKLKVAGATCSGVLTTDQCFNSATTAETVIVAGTEMFGMKAAENAGNGTTNGSTTNFTIDAAYDADVSTEYAWDDTNTDIIATSGANVVDDEIIDLTYGATASSTTPTGQYTVLQTFIATATF